MPTRRDGDGQHGRSASCRDATQKVSTNVTEDDYALAAHLTGDQPVGEWICEVVFARFGRRPSSSLDGAPREIRSHTSKEIRCAQAGYAHTARETHALAARLVSI